MIAVLGDNVNSKLYKTIYTLNNLYIYLYLNSYIPSFLVLQGRLKVDYKAQGSTVKQDRLFHKVEATKENAHEQAAAVVNQLSKTNPQNLVIPRTLN